MSKPNKEVKNHVLLLFVTIGILVLAQILSSMDRSLYLDEPPIAAPSNATTTSCQGTVATPAPPQQQIHMVVVADPQFASRYKPIFDKMDAYAVRHNYTWTVLGNAYFEEQGGTPTECLFHKNFFFLKHCMVAAWMEWQRIPPTDAVFVFDADVIPYRIHAGLEHWADNHKESVALYVRAWSEEIAAGNYLVRNTVAGRDFLRGWAKYEFLMPPGFSSADNGALHIHLLRYLGVEGMLPTSTRANKCGSMYSNLNAPVTNLEPYWNFVKCTRESLRIDSVNQTFTKGDFSVCLLQQRKGFVIDAQMDDLSSHPIDAPVFHHGVKVPGTLQISELIIDRYNLTLPPNFGTMPGVSCGGHHVATCGACGVDHNWCHGDCRWCPLGATGGTIPGTLNATHQCVKKSSTCRTVK